MNSHYSVMKEEAIDLLEINKDGIYVDGTLGRGGHSSEIIKRLDRGHLYAFDLDAEAIEICRQTMDSEKCTFIHANYAEMKNFVPQADGILLDLGVSSPQFDNAERGFSYRYDASLDMRMDQTAEKTAAKLVNEADEAELLRIFRNYGEVPFASRIVSNILKRRAEKPIETTFELVDVIKMSLPPKELAKKGHPAKQCFQALRIAVNDELTSLETFLNDLPNLLKINGVAVVITFHSLEDRLVKNRFKELSTVRVDKRIALRPEEIPQPNYILPEHKVRPSARELDENHRSHSAILRVIKRVG
ncbi:MAG: 16S rRNA (cytosine(1402)-N(4))-methyltransferase RsmH [Erysipelotrichaceae bacterium]|nr:16S rRNA (cytosine(1402)-N(4))-methyltransferase RsmH [Erysipelotrichaceae bacterium]